MDSIYRVEDIPFKLSFDEKGNIIFDQTWPFKIRFAISIKAAAEFCHILSAMVEAASLNKSTSTRIEVR